ncbi:hypothetical protein MBLNU230_g4193t1 [Neophaeotheca triangularis]
MPRDGSGAGDNAIENSHNIVHGNDQGSKDAPASSGVDRSNKAAPMPQAESGEALEGMNASGGGSQANVQGTGNSGLGDAKPSVDKIAENAQK